jgi:hypothetical protein
MIPGFWRGFFSCMIRLYTCWILAIFLGGAMLAVGEGVLIAWPELTAFLGEDPAQWLCLGPGVGYVALAYLRMGERAWTLQEDLYQPAPNAMVAIREGVDLALWPIPGLIGRWLDHLNRDRE